jgi:hypothetical protein
MKYVRLLAVPLFAAIMTLGIGAPRASADPRDFTLYNTTSATVFAAVYVAPSASADWEDDILGTDVLLPGQSLTIHFGRFNPSTCMYDVMVTGKDGSTGEIDNIDLCSTSTVTFHD